MRRRRHTQRRGRTRPGRLRLLDRLMQEGLIALPQSTHPLLVDLGFGDQPLTTLEWQRAMSEGSPTWRVIGVEYEKSRSLAAQIHENERLRFVEGGFDLRKIGIENASSIRCLNVLRGYGSESWAPAQAKMASALMPGGVLIEGTSDTEGHLLAVHLWRRSLCGAKLEYEALVLASDFQRGFAPRMFGDVLPRDLRRHVKEGEPIFEWLSSFQQAFDESRQHAPSGRKLSENEARDRNRSLFQRSARLLAKDRSDTLASDEWLKRGSLAWRPERPSHRSEVLRPGPLF